MFQELDMEYLQDIEGGRDWYQTLKGVVDAGLGAAGAAGVVAGIAAPVPVKEKVIVVTTGVTTYLGGLETIYNAY